MSRNTIRRRLIEQPEHVLQAGEFYICVPEESTNLVTNPSLEVDTTGWTASLVTMSRSTTRSYYGAASLKLVYGVSNAGSYAYSQISVSSNTLYTLSAFAYVESAAGAPASNYAIAVVDGATTYGVTGLTLRMGAWVKYELTFRTGAATTSVYIDLYGPNGTVYWDGIQLEAKPYATTYIDGEQDDCVWTGARHASASYRPPTTRKGGRLQPMKNYKFKIGAIIGAGAAALTTLATPYAQTGGGYYQGSIAPPRTITITGAFECDSAIDLARRRAELLSAVTPLATPQGQPARLVYVPQSCGGNIAEGVVIDGVYSGGLEGNVTNDVGYERASLTFNVYLPFAAIGKSAGDRSVSTTISNALSSPSDIVTRNRITGAWSTLSGGDAGGIVKRMVASTDGLAYILGAFTSIGGVSANYAAKWTGSTFTALSTGPTSASGSQPAAVDASNNLYYGYLISATSARVQKWNGSAWSTLADFTHGSDVRLDAIAVGPDGLIYVAGQFTNAGGTAITNIAKYNGSAWSAMSTAPNGRVRSLAFDKAGNLYAGGDFTTIGGVTVNSIAQWDGSAWSALGAGMTKSSGTCTITTLYVSRSGTLYAYGDFDTAGGVDAKNIAQWNGGGWYPLGAGLSKTVTGYEGAIYEDDSPGVVVAGYYTLVSDSSIQWVTRWTGSTWIPGPVYFATGSGNYLNGGMTVGIYEFLYGSYNAMTVPAVTSVTVNTQTSDVKAVFTGPGQLLSLKNYTTGDEVFFNLTLQAGEVATLTMGQPFKMVSTWRGDISGTIIANSKVSRFRLLPGANNIALLMTGTTGASAAALVTKEMYASLDYSQ